MTNHLANVLKVSIHYLLTKIYIAEAVVRCTDLFDNRTLFQLIDPIAMFNNREAMGNYQDCLLATRHRERFPRYSNNKLDGIDMAHLAHFDFF